MIHCHSLLSCLHSLYSNDIRYPYIYFIFRKHFYVLVYYSFLAKEPSQKVLTPKSIPSPLSQVSRSVLPCSVNTNNCFYMLNVNY